MRYLMIILSFWSISVVAQSQKRTFWPAGKKMALSLTFDDGRGSQVQAGVKLLNQYGAKATFYVMPNAIEKTMPLWRELVKSGHEIGNHTLFHPCSGNFAWSRSTALEEYSLEKMAKELGDSNRQISELLGVVPESFAYPCGQTFVGNNDKTQSYVPLVYRQFSSGRGWRDEAPNDPAYLNMAQLTGMEMDGKDFEELLPFIQDAAKQGHWLILAGHEMGIGGNQTTRLAMLEKLIQYAQKPENGIWLAPVKDVTHFLKVK